MIPTVATGDEDIYVTADTHFYHGNIIKYCHRPFLGPLDRAELERRGGRWHDGAWKGEKASDWRISTTGVEIMNQALIDNINKTVPTKALLIHAGDFRLWQHGGHEAIYIQSVQDLLARINCKNIGLVWGNHDTVPEVAKLFKFAWQRCKVVVHKNLHIIIDHYANLAWDRSHRNAYHVYGHSHSDIEAFADKLMPGRRAMDIGVDNAAKVLGEYRPFHIKEIIGIMSKRPGFSLNPDAPTDYKGVDEEQDPTNGLARAGSGTQHR
jgi:calcineurin-like phosphoesterase family protein